MKWSSCRATRAERRRPLPADPLVPEVKGVVNHAITIDAPPDRVWPWLVQMGSSRAGWYAWDFVDNAGERSATRIEPGLQHVRPGDVMPALPGAKDAFIVAEVEPVKSLVLKVPDPNGGNAVAWGFYLEPLPGGRTRLLVRGRLARSWMSREGAGPIFKKGLRPIERVYALLPRLPAPVTLAAAGFGHRLMQNRQLRGIKRRAEGRARRSMEANTY